MEKLRLFIYYKIIDEPWGGGNSFLKAFKKFLLQNKKDEIKFVDNIKDECDIFLINGGHKAPGTYIDLKEIEKVKSGSVIKKVFKKYIAPKIIYRLDGARYKYNKTKSPMDDLQFKACNIADFIIFQSKECLDSFVDLGYNGKNYQIVHNGVDQQIFSFKNNFWNKKDKLKILSCSWSKNIYKGFETIAKFSENKQVECVFVGNWNEDIDKKNVKVIPPIKQEELANYYKESDIFLHPAENDPCPNVLLEAMSSGLPVIYHNSGGSPEIAQYYGVPLPDKINSETINIVLEKIKNDYEKFIDMLKKEHKKFSIETAGEEYLKIFKREFLSE